MNFKFDKYIQRVHANKHPFIYLYDGELQSLQCCSCDIHWLPLGVTVYTPL